MLDCPAPLKHHGDRKISNQQRTLSCSCDRNYYLLDLVKENKIGQNVWDQTGVFWLDTDTWEKRQAIRRRRDYSESMELCTYQIFCGN